MFGENIYVWNILPFSYYFGLAHVYNPPKDGIYFGVLLVGITVPMAYLWDVIYVLHVFHDSL